MTTVQPVRGTQRAARFLAVCVVFTALVGCEQYTSAPVFPPLLRESSATASLAPPATVNARGLQPIIVSIEENGYAHLFVYSPSHSAFSRLTWGQWSDITPAISPDGRSAAFASNRSGFWDLYLIDLQTSTVSQLTDTPAYDASPSWSPDMAWMAYETYASGHLDIAILSLTDASQPPVQLTDDAASDHSPAWAPSGRRIAFVSDRSGSPDIWLADLDKSEDRFTDVSGTPEIVESHPAWNPDGIHLAWAATVPSPGFSGIFIWDGDHADQPAAWEGAGDWPAWNAFGTQLVTSLPAPNGDMLGAFTPAGGAVLLPTPVPGRIRGLAWANTVLPDPPPNVYQEAANQTVEAPLVGSTTPEPGAPAQRWYVVPLADVVAPYAQLHAQVAPFFDALRQRVISDAGWDALASLENAYVPLTTALDPGFHEDWLYTGRAFAINSLMVNAGWLAVTREDIGDQTYWRLYVRAQKQDGSQGSPIEDPPWDITRRFQLDPQAYEAGGAYTPVPPGYWVDLTSLAAAYGWQRLPALSDWRNYYAGARFTEFVITGGLDWYSAMLQLYPAEALQTSTPVLPPTSTPSRTPTPTDTATFTRTPTLTFTATLPPTATPSITPTPAPTGTPTNTPQSTATALTSTPVPPSPAP